MLNELSELHESLQFRTSIYAYSLNFNVVLMQFLWFLKNYVLVFHCIAPFLAQAYTFGYSDKSVESQKGVIAAQRCSVENQKGAIAVQSQWQ